MSKFFHGIKDKVQNATNDLQQDLTGIKQQMRYHINPNHRHDEEHEIAEDKKRQEIRDSHRFNSFAPVRQGHDVKFFLQGADYFHALSELIDEAQDTIWILDWWLTPELYLRRPPAENEAWRIDRLLKRKAEQGVRIYICVYKEVVQSTTISSAHTKHFLERLHENISVMRHPDHVGGESTFYWSHHEKLVIVDNSVCCIGGLDLCFGRWDTHSAPLVDAPISDLSKTLFPGQDMNDCRVADFVKIDEWLSRQLDRLNLPRMPWTDCHTMFKGPAVMDLVQHFVERWNFVRSLKYKHDERFPLLAFPHAENDEHTEKPISDHPHRDNFAQGLRHAFHAQDPAEGSRHGGLGPKGDMDIQVLRSSADWSHGILTEPSIQNAYCQLIREATHFVYMENQFFVSSPGDGLNKPVENKIAQAIVQRVLSAARSGKAFRVYITIPAVPGFAGDVKDSEGTLAIIYATNQTICHGDNSICGLIRKEGYNPDDYIFVTNLRSFDRLPPPALVRKMQERSGYTWDKVQAALARIYVGDHADPDEEKKVQKIQIQEAAQGESLAQEETKEKKVRMTDVPKTVEEARAIITKWEQSYPEDAPKVPHSIAHCCMNTSETVSSQPWYGTAREEVESYVTEENYIHSKLLIVDDRTVLIGSANINDRSQMGDRDSEIAIVINDTNLVESQLNGKKHMASKFAATFRRHLFKLHLGILPPQPMEHASQITDAGHQLGVPQETFPETDGPVIDPLSDDFVRLWRGTAKQNLQHFQNVFHCVPSTEVETWEQYAAYKPKPPILVGHCYDPNMDPAFVRQELDGIRGHLVEYPLNFLGQEDLLNKARGMSVNFATIPIYI